MRIERRGERGAAARIDIDMPASITARRTPKYDSTWYIPGTFNIVVDASALFYRRLLLPIVAGLPRQPDAMLAMVAGHRDELVQNPAFLPLR